MNIKNAIFAKDIVDIEHPKVAKEYEQMKLDLWKKYEHNRDAYMDAKTEFVEKWSLEARKLYGERY